MKIALAQFNPTVGDFACNSCPYYRIGLCKAKKRGADGRVFRVFACADIHRRILVERPAFAERNATELARLAGGDSDAVGGGYVGRAVQDDTGKPVANSAALVADGKILFEQRKMLLPTYDVFDESRYFQPAHSQHTFSLRAEKLGITVKIAGTTRISGRNISTSAILWRSWWRREATLS